MNHNIISTIIDKVNDQHIKDEEDKIYAYSVIWKLKKYIRTLPIFSLITPLNKFPVITKVSSLEDLYFQIFYTNMDILLIDFILYNIKNQDSSIEKYLEPEFNKNDPTIILKFCASAKSSIYEEWKIKIKNNEDYFTAKICEYIQYKITHQCNSNEFDCLYRVYTCTISITKMHP